MLASDAWCHNALVCHTLNRTCTCSSHSSQWENLYRYLLTGRVHESVHRGPRLHVRALETFSAPFEFVLQLNAFIALDIELRRERKKNASLAFYSHVRLFSPSPRQIYYV
jgi:hypothetical protein